MAFLREEAESADKTAEPSVRSWPWLAVAAAVMILAGVSLWMLRVSDAGARFDRTIRRTPIRPIEARLSGVPYARYSARRGDSAEIPPRLHAFANAVLADAPTTADEWHRHGLASLVNGDKEAAVASLARAAELAPPNARFWSDLSAARVALGTARADAEALQQATTDAVEALRIDPTSPEARFNLAFALERRGLVNPAVTAYGRYLAVDAHSSWADEARSRRAGMLR